jgi:hypothetical protein
MAGDRIHASALETARSITNKQSAKLITSRFIASPSSDGPLSSVVHVADLPPRRRDILYTTDEP